MLGSWTHDEGDVEFQVIRDIIFFLNKKIPIGSCVICDKNNITSVYIGLLIGFCG